MSSSDEDYPAVHVKEKWIKLIVTIKFSFFSFLFKSVPFQNSQVSHVLDMKVDNVCKKK